MYVENKEDKKAEELTENSLGSRLMIYIYNNCMININYN